MSRSVIVAVLATVLVSAADLQAQERGRLVVTVADQTGGVLPNARVTVTGEDPATRAVAIDAVAASTVGVATFENVLRGRYTIQADFPGFQSVTVRSVRVRDGDTRQRIVLPLERLDESVTVARDPQTSGLDPRGDAFSTILTREQIDALPDDPEELEAVLKAMSPPGARIRIDGFTGGQLPPKSQIRAIRLPRMDSFAAQNHGGLGGALFIDIMTMPGAGPLTVTSDFTLRDDVLSARDPFSSSKGDESLHRYGFATSGTIIPGKSSFSLSGNVSRQRETDHLFAALADGTTLTEPVRRPVDGTSFNARFDFALSPAHAIRASYQSSTSTRDNLGVGGFSLNETAYSTDSSQHLFRLSENGPIGSRFFTETRLQLSLSDQQSISDVEAPTIRVLDAFTSGGAQQRGGRNVRSFEFASDLDYVRGNHSMRAGVLVEGAQYTSDQFSNYLGTYTFASLDDYLAGTPRTYTRRIGDPRVSVSNLQVGIYVQDDWRMSRSSLLSYGVRYETQTHMGGGGNLSPRVTANWSPFRAGHTTLRASVGYFYDWLDVSTYEQSLRVDGFRQQEVQILNPAFPDPGADGVVPPTNRYLLDDDRRYSTSLAFAAGVDRTFGTLGRMSVAYTWRDNRNILAGVNLNAPVDGLRPDERFANVVEARSVGASRSHAFTVGGGLTMFNWHRTMVNASYTWTKSESNTSGAFSLPANEDLSTEWGIVGPRHRASASLNIEPVRDVALSVNVSGQSGVPYNITTGFDDDGDGVFNDRPNGVRRNSAQSRANWTVSSRLSYTLGFGTRPQATGGPAGGPTTVQIGAGGAMGGLGGGAANKRVRVSIYAAAQNLLNRSNYVGYSGVLTSPFFGQPTGVTSPRKFEVGLRVGF